MRNGRSLASFFCKTTLMLILAVICAAPSYSQRITNVDFEVMGNTVKVSYDLDDCSSNEDYDVRLMLGRDHELTQINNGLSGDLKNVECGSSRVILWNVLSDRDELTGKIYFIVEVQQIHRKYDEPQEEVHENLNYTEDKWKYRRSWKADRGYIGGAIGLFTPYQNNSTSLYNPNQNGFFINTSIGYLPSLLLGVSTTVYFYGAPKIENFRITTWKSWGVMIGPLISLPIGNRVKWEIRPQIGYSQILPNKNEWAADSTTTSRSGVGYNISTGLRLNFGKRTCYMLNVEYLSPSRKFENYRIEPGIGLLGASFGFAYRFY